MLASVCDWGASGGHVMMGHMQRDTRITWVQEFWLSESWQTILLQVCTCSEVQLCVLASVCYTMCLTDNTAPD
jgi:hypothetical protein